MNKKIYAVGIGVLIVICLFVMITLNQESKPYDLDSNTVSVYEADESLIATSGLIDSDTRGIFNTVEQADDLWSNLNFIVEDFAEDIVSKVDDEVAKQEFLNSIKQTDIDRNKDREPSIEKIKEMTTKDLLNQFTKSTFCTFLLTSPWPIDRIKQCSKMFQELNERNDVIESAIAVLNEEIIDPDADPYTILNPNEFDEFKHNLNTMSTGTVPYRVTPEDLAMGKASLIMAHRCQILSCPVFFSKIKGYEVQLLSALVNSQEKILLAQKKAITKYPDELSYSFGQACEIGFSLDLVKTFWPKYHSELIESRNKGADFFVLELKRILNSIG